MPGTRAQGGVCKIKHWSSIALGAPSLAPGYVRSYMLHCGRLQKKLVGLRVTSTVRLQSGA